MRILAPHRFQEMTFKLVTQLKAPVAPVPKENMRHLPRQARDENRKQRRGTREFSSVSEHAPLCTCTATAPRQSARSGPAAASPCQNASVFELFLCLSQACLGKTLVFSMKWLKKEGVLRTFGERSPPAITLQRQQQQQQPATR